MTQEEARTYCVHKIRIKWLGDLSHALTEFVRYRELVLYLITTELRVRYRGSLLGFLWTLMNPLLQALVMWAVFSRFGKIEEKNYALLYSRPSWSGPSFAIDFSVIDLHHQEPSADSKNLCAQACLPDSNGNLKLGQSLLLSGLPI